MSVHTRLCWAARRAGIALARDDARRRNLTDCGDAPAMPCGHPDFVLAAAVSRGVLSAGQARLIGRNRLEGIPLSQTPPRPESLTPPCATGGKEPKRK